MTVQQVQMLLYPAMCATAFVTGILMIFYYLTIRRVYLVLVHALFFLSESAVLFLLALTTGVSPVFAIEQFRPLVLAVRFAMWLLIIASALGCARALLRKSSEI